MKRSVTKKPKLTKWFDGSKFVPFHVGEYKAGINKFPDVLRWWDGERWSAPYNKLEAESDKKIARRRKASSGVAIHFCGLAQNPEVKP